RFRRTRPRHVQDARGAGKGRATLRRQSGGCVGSNFGHLIEVAAYRLALLQGATRRPNHFSNVVSETPRNISTITGTKVLSISKLLAYVVIMKPRPLMVV